jgi:hypothetical protein
LKKYQSIFKESNKKKLNENQFGSPVVFTVIFLEILSQVRIYHWQSFGYAEHTALGNYYDAMSDLVDGFVESYQGKFGRVFVDVSKLEIEDMKEYSIINYVNDICSWLKSFRRELEERDSYNTTDLQNQLDEMIGATDKLKYLLTLS